MALVKLRNGKAFSSELDQTILDSAIQKNIALEYSCRTGVCGVCKAKVLNGKTKAKYEELALESVEKARGYILTCCRSAESDVDLDVDDLSELSGIVARTVPCRIDSVERVSESVMRVFLRTPKCGFYYLPGQCIEIIGYSGVRRVYSIANALQEDCKIEINIRYVPGGVLSEYWFNAAKVNDLLRFFGPSGSFFLRDLDCESLVFIATGTGIAPIKSMLEYLDSASIESGPRRILVYWGGRVEEDIYWRPGFLNISVQFVPVLSRPSSTWQGRVGYVQSAVIADGIELPNSAVYACGSHKMIVSAYEELTAAGLPSGKFYSDAFLSSGSRGSKE